VFAFRCNPLIVGAVVMLAIGGRAQAQGNGKGGGNGNPHNSSPPSSSALPNPGASPAVGASPLAWLDDATLVSPGSMLLTVSAMRWAGADLSEVDVPIVDASIGLSPRFQIAAIVPRIVGSADATEPVGGVGTSYFSGKVALLTGERRLKIAVSPMLEILGEGAAQGLAPGESRTQVGLPVSAEMRQGTGRVFASVGVFSRGRWFAGGGAGLQATPRVGLSVAFTRSWASDSTSGVLRDRRELSGGASYLVRPQLGVYGTIGRTIGTLDENGAGTTIGGGVSVLLTARAAK
jgi:hypothetical protein